MVERKLTTILAADVTGYSRLMGEDEPGTLATLKSYRETMAGFIASLLALRALRLFGPGEPDEEERGAGKRRR